MWHNVRVCNKPAIPVLHAALLKLQPFLIIVVASGLIEHLAAASSNEGYILCLHLPRDKYTDSRMTWPLLCHCNKHKQLYFPHMQEQDACKNMCYLAQLGSLTWLSLQPAGQPAGRNQCITTTHNTQRPRCTYLYKVVKGGLMNKVNGQPINMLRTSGRLNTVASRTT